MLDDFFFCHVHVLIKPMPLSYSSPPSPRYYGLDCLLIRKDNRDALRLRRLIIVEHSFLNKDVRNGYVRVLPYPHTEKLSSTV